MIRRRVAVKAAAVAAIATAVVLCVVALSHALYAYLTQDLALTEASAGLILAAVMALAAGLTGWLAFRSPFKSAPAEPESLTDRVVALAKERPLVATVAGLAAGFIFLRNPALATIVAAALTGAPHEQKPKRR